MCNSCGALVKIHSIIYAPRQLQTLVRRRPPTLALVVESPNLLSHVNEVTTLIKVMKGRALQLPPAQPRPRPRPAHRMRLSSVS